ncbi:Transcription factor vib-1 [Fusarium oxysporum f. sp. raphani]|uniref:Transcription factor vib-1 n=1 Tax=Fusarium oxysporum f. sp. raphani TaxID=96318 RepID=A0A8J5Q9L1_FUSOX|nr:Transcription factor vib-1 [Fusarium oxysporum f. sp. raphani]
MPSTSSPLSGRTSSNHTEMDQPSYPYSRYPQDDQEAYDRPAHPEIVSHHGYPNLKRSFSEAEPPAYQEIVQDLRDDNSKMTASHEHKLLAFKRTQDKHTIVDQQGRMQQLELSAQLHGMFFLSEMPANTSDGSLRQPELTCYRRNLFQISGTLVTPRGQLSVITESGETVAVSNMEVTISAIESVDGNPDDGTESDGEYAVYPIGWRRLQFRIATANNGRRKELQQHFVLHLKVVGTLANGTKTVLTESTTAPIVVRGRSPRNFQARKEIPLLGSSAGSRGQALVETGVGVVAGPLSAKHQEAKPRGIDAQLPRTAFTFNAPKIPGTQLGPIRSNSYPTWGTPPAQVPLGHIPTSGAESYPAASMGPLAGTTSFPAESQGMPIQSSMEPPVPISMTTTGPPQLSIHTTPLGSHDQAMNIPRYVDNPRPLKSPRHMSHPSIRSAGSVANTDASPEYRYAPYAPVNSSSSEVAQPSYNPETSGPPSVPARDYYAPAHTWTSAPGEHSTNLAYASTAESRPYPFPQDEYKSTPAGTSPTKTESSQPQASSVYNGATRGSFDAMHQYSWNGN